MWHYLTDLEAETHINMIQQMQPVMFAFAKVQSDLRISQKELAKAYVHALKQAGRYRGKDVETFANLQALMLRVACSHWLRDWKLQLQWATEFAIPRPPLQSRLVSDTQGRMIYRSRIRDVLQMQSRPVSDVQACMLYPCRVDR